MSEFEDIFYNTVIYTSIGITGAFILTVGKFFYNEYKESKKFEQGKRLREEIKINERRDYSEIKREIKEKDISETVMLIRDSPCYFGESLENSLVNEGISYNY